MLKKINGCVQNVIMETIDLICIFTVGTIFGAVFTLIAAGKTE